MLEQIFTRKPLEFDIFGMTSADCRPVAELHATRFTRHWSDGEFHSLLSQSTVYGFVAKPQNSVNKAAPGGFVLAREAAGESEILTIAVNSKHTRQSIGWRLMQAVIRETRSRGAETMFLEVDQNNLPAIGLYAKLGFVKAGERKAYYADANGNKSTALVMRRDLR